MAAEILRKALLLLEVGHGSGCEMNGSNDISSGGAELPARLLQRPSRSLSAPRPGIARRLAVAVLAAALVATACVVPVKPLSPKVTLSQVRVVRLQPPSVALRVILDVDNPNAYPLSVAELDAVLAVNGSPLADVRLPNPVTLPASAVTRADLEVTTTLDRVVEALRRGDAGAGTLPYEVTGTATLGDGLRLPFSRRGALPLPEWARMLTR